MDYFKVIRDSSNRSQGLSHINMKFPVRMPYRHSNAPKAEISHYKDTLRKFMT